MREWIIKATSKETGKSMLLTSTIYNDKEIAKNAVRDLNNQDTTYVYSLFELIQVEEVRKAFCDMTEAEEKEYYQAISDIDNDLHKIISYDEWSAKEYGTDSVDYYDTAISLYNAGYRKVKDVN